MTSLRAKYGEARPTILVTGASGQVGWEAVRELAPLGRIVAPGRGELDLRDPSLARAYVKALRPQVIVNAAAYTAVDRAESERDLSMIVNAESPGVLAQVAREVGALLVHYSTDYVFAGTKGAPYVETDATGPLSVYGATKLSGERNIVEHGGSYLILRTSWVYGARGANFLRTMLRLAHAREELRVVSDQYGAPTWSRSIAAATALLVRSMLLSDDPESFSGVYHLTSAGATSWFEFAEAILLGDPQRGAQRCRRVVPIATAEYPTAAQRPAYSVLDNGKLQASFGLALPNWKDQLSLVLADLQALA